jgi:hypothetical protein
VFLIPELHQEFSRGFVKIDSITDGLEKPPGGSSKLRIVIDKMYNCRHRNPTGNKFAGNVR